MKKFYYWIIPEVVIILSIVVSFLLSNCTENIPKEDTIAPLVISEPVNKDSDDPAIWLHPTDPDKSLILGTDKGGSLFAFGLDGKIIKSVSGMKRLNNVDVEYGLVLNGTPTDIAVTTDRNANKIHVFSLPDLVPIDGDGIKAFEGETQRRPMGIALYKRPKDGTIFAIVSRKEGPLRRYLWQYRMEDDGSGKVKFLKVREFGDWSGKHENGKGEIEAIVVDDALGHIYYSDELFGIRKYYADPDVPGANKELAHFGCEGFARDREGISIYTIKDGTGYIIVSDQQANKFRIYIREGTSDNPHQHDLVKVVKLSTESSDGSEVTNAKLNATFPAGLFVAMSDDKTYHFYSWADIAGMDLRVAPNR